MVAQKMVTEANVKTLRALLSGKYLKFSMSNESRDRFKEAMGLGDPYAQVKKLEEMGVITGYIPVLSEEGARLVRTLEAFFASNGKAGENHDPLVDVMGDE